MTLAEASRRLRDRKVSPVELTRLCLERIERLDPALNAFITVTAESALAEAHTAEAEIQSGNYKGPLHGIPVALKDLIDTAGIKTTAGSALFLDRVPTQDAEVVQRLKVAGAIFLGKLNLHEFAYGGTSAVSYFGPVRNPWNTDYSPGGSSGGSAAAVAAGMCFGAIGTDTGGSVREPAAYCGIVGFKPTYGSVSATGVIPLSQYFDHVGPMARTVEDARLMWLALTDGRPAQQHREIRTVRVGIPRDFFYERLEPEVESVVEEALTVLESLVSSLREVPPLVSDRTYAKLMEPYTSVLQYEAYIYHQESLAKHPELYQAATKKRILAGGDIPRSEYAESCDQIDRMRDEVTAHFQDIDVLLTPTTPISPLPVADLLDANKARPIELQMLRNTRPFNALGLPAISVPCGFTAEGLPVGLQIAGPPGGEAEVLALSQAYEQATEWHRRAPSI